MTNAVTFPEQLDLSLRGTITNARGYAKQGKHLDAALRLARAEGYARAKALYLESRKDRTELAPIARRFAAALGHEADLAMAFVNGQEYRLNIQVSDRGEYSAAELTANL